MTLTNEWLLKTIAELEEERDAVPGAVNEDAAMALAAMIRAKASLQAEAVYQWRERYEDRDRWDDCSKEQYEGFAKHPDFETRILYTAPPAPFVPDEINVLQAANLVLTLGVLDNGIPTVAMKVWNACRAAMLQGAEPVTTANKLQEETGSSLQLRNLIRQRHAEWSQATFGDVGPVGPLKHLSKEALEAAEEPDDLSEWADMQFLLWDAQRRAGISDGEITTAMEEKLKVNMARQWPEPKDGEPRLHIKAAPQQEVK